MTTTLSNQLVPMAIVIACASIVGAAVTWADPPGYLFMDINNDQALVVQKPHDQMKARISKQPTLVPDDLAAAIVADREPVGDDVILVYRGQLYIVPDKEIKGRLATQMVMSAAGGANPR